jgi:hypothetical protein
MARLLACKPESRAMDESHRRSCGRAVPPTAASGRVPGLGHASPWPSPAAFTGDIPDREALEDRARSLGVRVMGNVSRLTTMLATDDSFWGTKRDDAARLGTRQMTPEELNMLLRHLHPSHASRPPGQEPLWK